MKKSRLVQIVLPALLVGLGCVIFNAANAYDDKKKEGKRAEHKHDDHHHHHKGKTRVASSEQLMEGLVNPNCKALAKGMKTTDKINFKRIRRYAALLNESGYVLMADGRCPDKTWAASCKAMQTHSLTIIEKAKASDADGVNAAFKLLTTEGCGACHKKHKHH